MSQTNDNEHAPTDAESGLPGDDQAGEDRTADDELRAWKAQHTHSAPENHADSRRRVWLRWMVVVVALAVAGYFIVPKLIPVDVDDGFIAFDPDASLFPAAPSESASTLVGIGRPDSLPDGPEGCPYGIGWGPDTWFGNDWHTVRHDWDEAGSAKAWIISEKTTGFEDLDEYDDYMEGFFKRTKYCGWGYDGVAGRGFNSVLTELGGLPNGAFAFTTDASPWNREDIEKFGDSNPDEFSALTAVIPGPKRGQVMFYTWIGWVADVPRDEFVANANAMYDAARTTPDPAEPPADGGGGSEVEFVPFQFLDSDLLPIIGGNTNEGDDVPIFSMLCGRTGASTRLDIVDLWDQEYDVVVNDDRMVGISTARIDDGTYQDAKRSVISDYTPRCIDSVQDRRLLIEPITVPGVPDEAEVAVWHDSGGTYAAVVTDDDRQLIMVMAWSERNEDVPVEDFAEVLSSAWTQFQADNS